MKKNGLIDITESSGKKAKKESQTKELWRRLRKNKSAMAGLIILVFFILVALLADWIAPYEKAIEQNTQARLQPPSAEFIFGTDRLGRDVFARIV